MHKSFGEVYRGKKVVLTGNTGFKGAWLSVWLKMLGAEVYGMSIDIPSTPSIFSEVNIAKIQKHDFLDIRDIELVKKAFNQIQPDFVFHLAAQPIVRLSYTDPALTFSTNVMGTLSVLEGLRNLKKSCIAVLITSDKCYENVEWTWGYRENDRLGGKDPYSASKAAAENVIYSYFNSFFKESSLVNICSARAGNVIGGGDWASNRIVPDAMRAWSKGMSLTIRQPNATRPWQHVLEPLSGYLNLGQALLSNPNQMSGESFNFGPNADQNHSVLELLKALAKNWGIENFDDMLRVEKTNFHEAGLLKLSIDKAFHTLGWKPVLDFEETVGYTSSWYYQYYFKGGVSLEFMENQIINYTERAKNKGNLWTSK